MTSLQLNTLTDDQLANEIQSVKSLRVNASNMRNARQVIKLTKWLEALWREQDRRRGKR